MSTVRSNNRQTVRARPSRSLTRSISLVVAWCIALSISVVIAPRAASVATADAGAAATVLDSYRLGDTPEHRDLLRAAVVRKLTAEGTAATTSAIDAELLRVAALGEPDIEMTAQLAVELFDAIFAVDKTPSQAAFHEEFQHYYGNTQLRIATATLNAWNEYLDPNIAVAEYSPCCTLGVLYDTGPSVSGFVPPNNAIGIGAEGYEALDAFLAPMADAGIPDMSVLFDEIGYEPADGSAAAAAIQSGAGFSTASLALVYGAFAAYLSQTAAVTATFTNTISAVGLAGKITEVVIKTTSTTLSITAGSAAGTFAISALVVIPLLIAGGMKIADFVETQKFDEQVNDAVNNPDFDPDFDAIVGLKTDFDAGLWYTPCRDGHDGVATRCYSTECPDGYQVSALNCTQFADTIAKDSYDRGAGQVPTGCPAGQVLENGLCYPPCPDGFDSDGATLCYERCPDGWTGTLTTCNQPTQFWNPYILSQYELCAQNTGSCTQRGALYYVDCAAPYVFASLQTCEIPCPTGWSDGGVFCHRPTVSRGAGSVPSACTNGLEYLAGLCYVPCATGYTPAVTICLEDLVCPTGYSDTGLTCFRGFDTRLRSFYDRGVGHPYPPTPETVEANKAMIFSFLLKMLVADPADYGSISNPRNAPAPVDAFPTPNVAPTISLTGATIDEGGVAAVPGVVYDPNPGDSHVVTIDWGDGSGPSATDLVALASQQHRYRNDGDYTVTATVTDSAGESATTTASVVVNNVAPIVSLTGAAIDEGSTATVSAPFTDPGLDDTHTATIDWGDGSPVESVDAAELGPLSHVYVQDGVYDVTVEVYDGVDTGAATTQVVVVNVAPVVSAAGATIDEGGTATVVASFTDPGSADVHSATVDWGDGTSPQPVAIADLGDLRHPYGDDGVYEVAVTVADDDTSTTRTSSVTVTNVAPVVGSITTSTPVTKMNDCFVARSSDPFDLAVSATDDGSDDLTVDWSTGRSTTYLNDGLAPDQPLSPQGVYPFTIAETLPSTSLPLGGGSIAVVVTDDDGASTQRSLCAVSVGNESETLSAREWASRLDVAGIDEADLMGSYLSTVVALSTVFDEHPGASTLQAAVETLSYRGGDARGRLAAAALATWMNVASGASGLNVDRQVSLADAEALLVDASAEASTMHRVASSLIRVAN